MCEYADIWDERVRVARKNYRCLECKRRIYKGQRYIYTSALADGAWSNWRTCVDCARFIALVMNMRLAGREDNCYELGTFYSEYVMEWWDHPTFPRNEAPGWFLIYWAKRKLEYTVDYLGVEELAHLVPPDEWSVLSRARKLPGYRDYSLRQLRYLNNREWLTGKQFPG